MVCTAILAVQRSPDLWYVKKRWIPQPHPMGGLECQVVLWALCSTQLNDSERLPKSLSKVQYVDMYHQCTWILSVFWIEMTSKIVHIHKFTIDFIQLHTEDNSLRFSTNLGTHLASFDRKWMVAMEQAPWGCSALYLEKDFKTVAARDRFKCCCADMSPTGGFSSSKLHHRS